jgi:hypothetical protein
MRLTLKAAKATVKALGFTLTSKPDGEFRLCPVGGSEAVASYHDDLHDAIGTAKLQADLTRTVAVEPPPPMPYDIDCLNLDCMTIEDLTAAAAGLDAMHRYANRKIEAMTLRRNGDVNRAKLIEDGELERMYHAIPGNWRW